MTAEVTPQNPGSAIAEDALERECASALSWPNHLVCRRYHIYRSLSFLLATGIVSTYRREARRRYAPHLAACYYSYTVLAMRIRQPLDLQRTSMRDGLGLGPRGVLRAKSRDIGSEYLCFRRQRMYITGPTGNKCAALVTGSRSTSAFVSPPVQIDPRRHSTFFRLHGEVQGFECLPMGSTLPRCPEPEPTTRMNDDGSRCAPNIDGCHTTSGVHSTSRRSIEGSGPAYLVGPHCLFTASRQHSHCSSFGSPKLWRLAGSGLNRLRAAS
ncbi:hypothetical protein BV20DRAFT_376063 [Pilatotrama ljubarskyi]|nr:hypothetical protein BV20DRAFT_376063 [Pilatotrama ljubarskyi]